MSRVSHTCSTQSSCSLTEKERAWHGSSPAFTCRLGLGGHFIAASGGVQVPPSLHRCPFLPSENLFVFRCSDAGCSCIYNCYILLSCRLGVDAAPLAFICMMQVLLAGQTPSWTCSRPALGSHPNESPTAVLPHHDPSTTGRNSGVLISIPGKGHCMNLRPHCSTNFIIPTLFFLFSPWETEPHPPHDWGD